MISGIPDKAQGTGDRGIRVLENKKEGSIKTTLECSITALMASTALLALTGFTFSHYHGQ